MKNLIIYVVSDSVGETGKNAVKAVISQFRPNFENVDIRRYPHVKKLVQLEQIIEQAKVEEAAIVYTLVEREMLDYMKVNADIHGVAAIDLLGPMIDLFQRKTGEEPLEQPGLVHQLDEYYFEKIEAIEFAVKYDDGQDPRGILLADIVLLGVSRTSKTPLSQYLAHKRYKVANVPLVPEVTPPEELMQIDPKKCFGLVISPEKLNSIRKERLIALGLTEDAVYAQHSRIEEEIAYFHEVVSKIGCTVIDVTNRAVEETANKIIDIFEKKNK
jgi:[pyruvate, water dikinase]-phosphate phosphotransferase / [pyruvate, water dikinase] kinase